MIKTNRKKAVIAHQEPRFDDDELSNLYESSVVEVYQYELVDLCVRRYGSVQRTYQLDDKTTRYSLFNDFRKIKKLDDVKPFLEIWGEPYIGMSAQDILVAAKAISWLLKISQLAKTHPSQLYLNGWFHEIKDKSTLLAMADVFCRDMRRKLRHAGYDDLVATDDIDFKAVILSSLDDSALYSQTVPPGRRQLFQQQMDDLLKKTTYFGFCPEETPIFWQGIHGAAEWITFNQLVVKIPSSVSQSWRKRKYEGFYAMLCTLFLKNVFDILLKDVHPTAQLVVKIESLKHNPSDYNHFFLAPALSIETPYEAVCLALYDTVMGTQPGKTCDACGDFFIPTRSNKSACSANCRKRKSKAKKREG